MWVLWLSLGVGLVLMAVALAFIAKKIGSEGETVLHLPLGLKVEKASTAVVVFSIGALFFGGSVWQLAYGSQNPNGPDDSGCSDNIIACGSSVAIYVPEKSSSSFEISESNSLRGKFKNTAAGTGVALRFETTLDVGPFRFVEIVGRSSQPFSFEIQYKVKDATGKLSIVDATGKRPFPRNSNPPVRVPLSWDGRVNEVVLNFPDVGQTSELSIDSISLIE